MSTTCSFDSELTRNYTQIRQAFISEFLDAIHDQVDLKTALDIGCGVGHFSKFLSDRGLHVVAIDGRDENAREGRHRYPEIEFLTKDVEDAALPNLGVFDLVLCVGLLYHLENPFRAIRNLHALTSKILFVESMCAPGRFATMELLDEVTMREDQGLNFVAFYPSEPCLVKMLYCSGFPFVYSFSRLPNHPPFRQNLGRKRERTMMVASNVLLTAPNLALAQKPVRPVLGLSDLWTTPLARSRYLIGNLRRSLFKTFRNFSHRRKGLP